MRAIRIAANRTALLAACVWFASSAAVAQPDVRALSAIKRAMERDLRTNYSAVRVLHFWGAKEPMRIRRDQNELGHNSIFVLSPLSKQGETSVDDGRTWITFYPDRRTLVIQDSPIKRGVIGDPAMRFELLKRNYRVRTDGNETVAGRPCRIVRISPVAPELFTRRYWIDEEKSVLLRVEWRSPEGVSQIVSDTISIEYPASFPQDAFQIKVAGEPRRIEVQAPQRMSSIDELERRVGFTIRQPIQLPFGFVMTGADAVIANNRAMAALRYTDGATNLTIYQAQANPKNPPWRPSQMRGDFELEGLLIAVEGDIPIAGRTSVIAALKASTATREAALVARAAQTFQVSESVVRDLRSKGLGFHEVVSSLILAGRDEERRAKCVEYLAKGRCVFEISRMFGKTDADVRRELANFWERKPPNLG